MRRRVGAEEAKVVIQKGFQTKQKKKIIALLFPLSFHRTVGRSSLSSCLFAEKKKILSLSTVVSLDSSRTIADISRSTHARCTQGTYQSPRDHHTSGTCFCTAVSKLHLRRQMYACGICVTIVHRQWTRFCPFGNFLLSLTSGLLSSRNIPFSSATLCARVG